MKENISKNKVWQIVGISVLCAVLVLGAVLSIVFGMRHNITDNQVLPKDMSDKPDDSVVIETQEECGIKLTSSGATTASDGTMSKVLTATITPNDAITVGFTWTVSFKNASSSWATGKTVTDYVTVTKDSSNDLKATVTCLKPFGEQIIVKIKCDYSDASATATVDYKARVASGSVTFESQTPPSEDITLNIDGTSLGVFSLPDGSAGSKYPEYRLNISVILTDGTIKNEMSVKIVHPDYKDTILLAKDETGILTHLDSFEFPFQNYEEQFDRELEGVPLCVQLLYGTDVAKEWIVNVNIMNYASSVSIDATTIVF